MTAAGRVAERRCENAPLAVRATKEAFLRGQRLPLAEGVRTARLIWERLKQSEDTKEGLAAFLEKRKPVWKAR
jgi:enoyl-CoA hydratase/carnithine racemase